MALIALFIVLVVSNIAFALLWMTKDVDISGGVDVVGSIEVHDDDGVTPLTGFTFSNFTPGVSSSTHKTFFINNTGNGPVYVYWNISAPLTWEKLGSGYYRHNETVDGFDVEKYQFGIENATGKTWLPDTEGYNLDIGEGALFTFSLFYTGNVNTAEKLTLTASFYARDS